jgi:hypothetical protein
VIQRFTPKNLYLLSFIYLFLLISACTPSTDSNKGINHIILVWFKADTTPEEVAAIMQATQKLTQLPQVQSLQIGSAIASERKIVDDSFSLGIYMYFANQQDMDSYLSHPQHLELVNTLIKPKLEKLLVYDF